MRAILGFVVPLLVLSTQVAEASDSASAADLFEQLGARSMPCPDQVEATLRPDQRASCAALETSFKEFKRALGKVSKDLAGARLVADGSWEASGPWQKRAYRRNSIPIWISFNEQVGGVLFIRGWHDAPCEVPLVPEPEPLPEGTVLEGAVRVRHVPPDYPQNSASRPVRDAEVVLRVKIDVTGQASTLCVVSASPAGQGFEQAAMESIEKWGYEPATVAGRPVETAMLVIVMWNRE